MVLRPVNEAIVEVLMIVMTVVVFIEMIVDSN